MHHIFPFSFFFFFNDTATTEIYTLSLHDALPILPPMPKRMLASLPGQAVEMTPATSRSEEHTSELQSRSDLVCRLLLEKKKNKNYEQTASYCAQHMTAMRAFRSCTCTCVYSRTCP